MGLIITFILGIFILIGVGVIKIAKNGEKIELLSISIALGTMICLVIFDLIPEAVESFSLFSSPLKFFIIVGVTVIGIVLLMILDKFIPEHDDEHGLSHECSEENLVHIGIVSSLAIILHNIIEGMAIYSLSNTSLKLSILTAIGVGLHNIPMGMVIYSTLKNDNAKKRGLLLLFLVTVSTFIGGIIMMILSSLLSELFIGILICLTLGMLLYIIIFELIPHLLHNKNKIVSLVGVIVGILIIIFSTFFE